MRTEERFGKRYWEKQRRRKPEDLEFKLIVFRPDVGRETVGGPVRWLPGTLDKIDKGGWTILEVWDKWAWQKKWYRGGVGKLMSQLRFLLAAEREEIELVKGKKFTDVFGGFDLGEAYAFTRLPLEVRSRILETMSHGLEERGISRRSRLNQLSRWIVWANQAGRKTVEEWQESVW